MGRQAFPVIGGIIGAVVAAVATDGAGSWQGYEAGFAIGAAIGGIAGSYIDPLVIQGNTIGDTQLQVAAEGGARAMMYGRACVSATCVIARGNRQVVKKKQSNGKGSSGSTANQFVYWTFAIGLGESLVGASIARIWQDDNLVYDVLGDGAISSDDNLKFAAKFKFYDGDETQLPDPDLQVFLAAETPYFRGTSYVVFPNFDLTQTAERIPQFKFEILQGVAGIVDEEFSLEWVYPTAGPGEPEIIEKTQVLTGSDTQTFSAEMKFTGNMETRPYAYVIDVIGGQGHFVKTLNDGPEVFTYGYISYAYVEISNPFQRIFLNYSGDPMGAPGVVVMDGSDDYTITVDVAGDATIILHVNNEDGSLQYPGENCLMEVTVTGIIPGANTTIGLDSVVDDLLLKSGMTSDQFDTSALTDQIAGVCIQQTVAGGDAVGSIVAAFFADPTEKDAKLSWVKRGGAVLRTLTIDDLTEEPDVMTRENVIEYPAKLSFFYQSPLTGYELTKATSFRYSPQADSSGEGSVTSPVTFYNSDIPAQIAQKLHKVAWTEAEGTFTWKVGPNCIDLIPSDVLGLSLRGIISRVRITAIENDGTTLTLTMIKDRQSSYTSTVTGIPLPMPTPPQPTTMSKAVLGVLDIPALQDADDGLLYYTAMSGSTNVWQGGELDRSLDSGANWTAIGQVTTDVTMGKLTTAMTATDAAYTDTTNAVTVQLFDSANDLVSYTDTTFNQEQGAIAVQLGDGTWEVMQYRDAVDNGNGLHTLSYLKRGRLTTTPGAHAVGALFVQLSQYLVVNPAQTSYLGGVLQHRAVSYDTSNEDATVVSTTFVGRSQLEWSPASASAEFDGTYVYVFDIVPRHRFGTEVNPIASVNFTGFRVTLTDGTTTVTADILAGDSAHILAAPLTGVTDATVAAINKITGAGHALDLGAPEVVADGSLTPEAIVNGGDI